MDLFVEYKQVLYAFGAAIAVVVALGWLCSPKNMRLPPGPRGWPIVGNLFDMGTHPHKTLAKMAQKYGPLMYLRLGQKGCIIASSPAMAKEFLKNQDANFAGRPHLVQGDILFYNRQGIAWQSATPGWRHLRKLFQVELTGLKRLEASKHVRSEEVCFMLRSIAKEKQVDVQAQLSIMTSNIISRMILNKRYVAMADENTVDQAEAHAFQEMIEETFLLTGTLNLGDFIPALRWLDLQGYGKRLKKIHIRLDKFVSKIIADHRTRRQNASVAEIDKDMVDVLLDELETKTLGYQMTEANVKSIILDAFIAATDTMIVTTGWTMSEIVRNPLVMEKACAELQTVVGDDRLVQESDLPQLKYLQSIIKESFRLHPAGPLLIPHESIEACKASGYHIPAKTRMMVNVYAIGRDPSVWESPLEFKPERFMEGEIYSKIDVRGQDFVLIPFGSGRRMCPAMPMANLVVQFVVASLLQTFHWSLPDGMDPKDLDMTEGMGLSVPRAVPLRAIATPRLSPSVYDA